MGFQSLNAVQGWVEFFSQKQLNSHTTVFALRQSSINFPVTWFIMWSFFCWTSNQFQHKLVKKNYQVHLNQWQKQRNILKGYNKDIYVKSYTTHVKTHSSWTLSVVLVCCPILFSSTGHKSISSVPARVRHCMNPAKDREMTPTKSIRGPLWPFPSLIMSLLLQL